MTERPQTTVLDALTRRLAADADGPYLDFEGDEYTARRMDAESNRLARALGELGVGKGDRVATLLENGPAQVVSFFAALKLGAVQVPVNTRAGSRPLAGRKSPSWAQRSSWARLTR